MLNQVILSSLLFFSMAAGADQRTEINRDLNSFLARFSSNSVSTMNELPAKFDRNGKRIHQSLARGISVADIATHEFVTLKDKARLELCKQSQYGANCRSPIQLFAVSDSDNIVERFFPGTPIETQFERILSLEFSTKKLAEGPWSGDYWPTYRLGIAQRYEDESYPESSTYKDYVTFYQKQPEPNLNDQAELDILSPAEKYDILIGDKDLSLTKWNISYGEMAYTDGKPETWVGICHGWAPAAYMVSRPQSIVRVPLSTGTELRFYPHDIKALVTQLWANTNFATRFLGGRCNVKNPKMDDNGRVLDRSCFDVNPAAWHIAIVNEVGIRNKSLVLDATYDFEVWNQPITAYEVQLFNPETKALANTIDEAKISLADYKSDTFAKYRGLNSKSVIGVSMRVSYALESRPSHIESDSSEEDIIRTVHYVYDLELDANNKIIGGEWYQNAHPDFIWTPFDNVKITSVADSELSEMWDGSLPPKSWTSSALKASSYGQPLAGVVERLVDLSQPRK